MRLRDEKKIAPLYATDQNKQLSFNQVVPIMLGYIMQDNKWREVAKLLRTLFSANLTNLT